MSMDLEKLNKKLEKDREKYLIKKYEIKEQSVLLMGLNINKMYYVDKNIIDLSLIIHIQEEGYGSLFTQPAIYVRYQSNNSIYWLKKDFYALNYAYNEKNLDKLVTQLDLEATYIKMSEESQKYCRYLVDIINNYEWDHFVNIGSFERAEQDNPKIWHSLPIKDKNEKIWIGSLSQQNWLETLSLITSFPKEEFYKQMTNLLSQYNKENLEINLPHNPQIAKRNKI